MRKLLATIAILVVALAAIWVFAGSKLALVVDRFYTAQTASVAVRLVNYEGAGTGGVLQIENDRFNLAPADSKTEPPHVGSTKSDELGLAYGGKVFGLGTVRSPDNQPLTSEVQSGDAATLITRHSVLVWPNASTLLKDSRAWRRYEYRVLNWKKANGAQLELVWRNEQFYDSGKGWSTGVMTHGGATGLIRVEISGTDR